MEAERAVSPVDGSELWVVLDAELLLHRESSDFLRCLQIRQLGAGTGYLALGHTPDRPASPATWTPDPTAHTRPKEAHHDHSCIILLILGFVFSIPILWTIGIILIVVGAILAILGATGRAIGGRKHWY